MKFHCCPDFAKSGEDFEFWQDQFAACFQAGPQAELMAWFLAIQVASAVRHDRVRP